jgi:hypothetical protein
MKIRRSAVYLTLVAFLLSACNLPVFQTTPVPSFTPAVVATSEAAPTATAESEGPSEAIYIFSPGPSSMVVSPITISGQADPTFEQNLVIAIYDESGAELALEPTIIQADVGQRGPYSIELEFSVGNQQAGRISVFSISAMDGGLVHLSSVDVVLMPSGEAQLTTPSEQTESIRINAPETGAEVSGGVINLSGYSDYYFESNLGMVLCGPGGSGSPHELCGSDDNILASGPVMIQSPDIGQPGPFEAEITYTVSEAIPARLVLFAASPRDGGFIHVTSINIQLNP